MAIIFMSEVGGQVLNLAGEDGTCAKRQNRNIFGKKLTMENILLIFLENCQFLQSKYISSHFFENLQQLYPEIGIFHRKGKFFAFIFAKDCLITCQEQACIKITRLFVCLFGCHYAKNGPIHRKMVVDCPLE